MTRILKHWWILPWVITLLLFSRCCYHAAWTYSSDYRPTRIVQRSDGKFEIERLYGGFGWGVMGTTYATLDEARVGVAEWRAFDERKNAEERITRKVVE